nr:hypothetical protein CFP56_33288 [Quercus suber]
MVFFFKTWSNRRQRRKSKSVCDDVVWCGNGFSFRSSGILCLCDFSDDGDGKRKLMWNRGRMRMKSMRMRKKTRPPLEGMSFLSSFCSGDQAVVVVEVRREGSRAFV